MANLGMTEFRSNGTDYTINDPNIADEFDPTAGYYTAGTPIYNQGKLYVFTEDHDPGAWNSAEVQQVKLGEQVRSLKSELCTRIGDIEKSFDLPSNRLFFDADHYCNVSSVSITNYYDDGFQYVNNAGTNISVMFVFKTESGSDYRISFEKTGNFVGGGIKNNPYPGTKPSYIPSSAYTLKSFDTSADNAVYTFTATGSESLMYFTIANGVTLTVRNAVCISLDEYDILKDEALPNSVITAIKDVNAQGSKIGERITFVSNKNDFTVAGKAVRHDGTIDDINSRNLTDYIPVKGCKSIIFKLSQYAASDSVRYNTISFYDSTKTYISGSVSKKFSGNIESITGVPSNAAYVVGSWLMLSDAVPYMIGIYDNGNTEEINGLIVDDPLNGTPTVTVVNGGMNIYEWMTAINNYWTTYATACRCRPWSFMKLKPTDENGSVTIDDYANFCELLNKNFRQEVTNPKYSFAKNCNRINNAFSMPIIRFMDARLNTTQQINFSLPTGLVDKTEPSIIVSEDQKEMYLYTYLKRLKTTDGVNWSEPENCTGFSSRTPIHNNVALIDGTYYLFGALGGGTRDAFIMGTSTDGINFTDRGDLFRSGYEFVEGESADLFGNSTILKDYGSNTYYLYVEYMVTSEHAWKIALVTATDLFTQNQDGTIGNWTNCADNPVMDKIWGNLDGMHDIGAGNPDIMKGVDNRPIKYNDKYYFLVHSTHNHLLYSQNGVSNILRLSSMDLVHWETDGLMFDNRDIPTEGDGTSGNADQAIIEFKGRTYLFYSWNVNHFLPETVETIKYMIDDRPISELLKLRP